MSMKIRLARGGSKKRPFYRIVAADSRMPRDGRFIEKLGTYNPLLPKDSEERVKMDLDAVKAWLDKGAQPTDRVARFLSQIEVDGKPVVAQFRQRLLQLHHVGGGLDERVLDAVGMGGNELQVAAVLFRERGDAEIGIGEVQALFGF